MATLEQIASAAVRGEALVARSLAQEWLGSNVLILEEPAPQTTDPVIRSLTAALAELFARRLNQSPPAWAKGIGAAPREVYLLKAAATMRRLRAMCFAESPDPLKRRRIYAPGNYLESA